MGTKLGFKIPQFATQRTFSTTGVLGVLWPSSQLSLPPRAYFFVLNFIVRAGNFNFFWSLLLLETFRWILTAGGSIYNGAISCPPLP